jgi:hypothetical protein
VQLARQRKTWRGYCVSLRYFKESCDKYFLAEIERKDLLRFAAFLRDRKKLSPRIVQNKFGDVLTFLQAQGLPNLIGKKRLSPLYRTGGRYLRERRTVEAARRLFAVSQHTVRVLSHERLPRTRGYAFRL